MWGFESPLGYQKVVTLIFKRGNIVLNCIWTSDTPDEVYVVDSTKTDIGTARNTYEFTVEEASGSVVFAWNDESGYVEASGATVVDALEEFHRIIEETWDIIMSPSEVVELIEKSRVDKDSGYAYAVLNMVKVAAEVNRVGDFYFRAGEIME